MSANFSFRDFHAPGLEAGDYTAIVNLTAAPPSVPPAEAPPVTTGTKTVQFSVKGERFAVLDSEVISTWPPKSAQGDFHGHLPHVILRRKTLPWERSGRSDGTEPPTPWLFVLLFEYDGQSEPAVRTVAAEKLNEEPKTFLYSFLSPASKFTNETQQDPKESVALLDIDAAILKSQLPKKADHLRYCSVAREPGGSGSEVAVVMGAQIIRRGTSSDGGTSYPVKHYVAHLVSLESCYGVNGALLTNLTNQTVTLISLYRWRFTSHDQGNFLSWCQKLSGVVSSAGSPSGRAIFKLPGTALPGADAATAEANAFLDAGSVPSLHYFAQGDIRRSWYRGPLVAGVPADGAMIGSLPIPASHPDQLLLYSSTTGLFDATYAAAWQLGRFLMLRDRPVAAALDLWKRARGRTAAKRRGELEHRFLPHAAAKPVVSDFPDVVSNFLGALGRLNGVPNTYLVPDPSLLPPESLRFVEVDADWVLSLLDGALSVGRIGSGEKVRDTEIHGQYDPMPRLSGFLLHSKIVDHFPSLEVMAKSASADLPPVFVKRLTPRALLALFEVVPGQVLDQVILRLPPEAMHFAVEEQTNGEWANYLRLADTTRSTRDKIGDGTAADADGVLKLDQLLAPEWWTAGRLTCTPSEFAFQMLGAPPVFTITRPRV